MFDFPPVIFITQKNLDIIERVNSAAKTSQRAVSSPLDRCADASRSWRDAFGSVDERCSSENWQTWLGEAVLRESFRPVPCTLRYNWDERRKQLDRVTRSSAHSTENDANTEGHYLKRQSPHSNIWGKRRYLDRERERRALRSRSADEQRGGPVAVQEHVWCRWPEVFEKTQTADQDENASRLIDSVEHRSPTDIGSSHTVRLNVNIDKQESMVWCPVHLHCYQRRMLEDRSVQQEKKERQVILPSSNWTVSKWSLRMANSNGESARSGCLFTKPPWTSNCSIISHRFVSMAVSRAFLWRNFLVT